VPPLLEGVWVTDRMLVLHELPMPGPTAWVLAAASDSATAGCLLWCLCRYYCNASLGITQWTHPGQPSAALAGGGGGGPAFMPSPSFTGPRAGYYFGKGPQGVGYYQDSPLATRLAEGVADGVGKAGGGGRSGGGSTLSSRLRMLADAAPPVALDDEEGGGGGRGPKKSRMEWIAEQQAARNAARAPRRSGGRRGGGGGDGDIDPMDPSSYSDAPRGGWSSGLEAVQHGA
jgi:hypothetical protein